MIMPKSKMAYPVAKREYPGTRVLEEYVPYG